MAKSNNTLCLDKFYPERDLIITDIAQQSDKIIIRMKSTSSSCKCPKCNHITQKYHGTYTRKVQDLPILGKQVQLEICSHEYACEYSCAVTPQVRQAGQWGHGARIIQVLLNLFKSCRLQL